MFYPEENTHHRQYTKKINIHIRSNLESTKFHPYIPFSPILQREEYTRTSIHIFLLHRHISSPIPHATVHDSNPISTTKKLLTHQLFSIQPLHTLNPHLQQNKQTHHYTTDLSSKNYQIQLASSTTKLPKHIITSKFFLFTGFLH